MTAKDTPSIRFDAVVAGAGPAGLVAALALEAAGLDVALVAPPVPANAPPDTRTTALFGGSIELLRNLGVWPLLATDAEPLTGLRLVDDTGALVRAPETLFRASELGLDTFGYNLDNVPLTTALGAAAAQKGERIRRFIASVSGLGAGMDAATVRLSTGTVLTCSLVAAADGRNSFCREAAGIAARRWTYPQAAITTKLRHTRPHAGISTELHRRAGPLTTVPLKGLVSSLVWVETPAEADRLRALPDAAFARELETRLQGLLGDIGDIGPRTVFPLSRLTAESLAQGRVALVGEAAHVIPPIGAQGLNLGFRDAAWLAELAGRAKQDGRDPGAPEVTAAYARARAGDVGARSTAVDMLNRSLIADLLPVDLLRGAGLAALNMIPWLRRSVMRQGIEPATELPPLLRPPGIGRSL